MDENFCDDVKARRFAQRYGVWIFATAILGTLIGGVIYASQGTPDPTESARRHLPRRDRREQRHHRLPRGPRGRPDLRGGDRIDAGRPARPAPSGRRRRRRRLRRHGRDVVPRPGDSRPVLALRRPAAGDHRPDRDRRPARRHELVLPQGLLDEVDREAQRAAQARARRAACIGGQVVGLLAARLLERLPRGLRGRAVPADPAAAGRNGDGARGCRDRSRRNRRRRRRHVLPAAEAAVQAHARRHRRHARRRARRHGRRQRPHAAGRRLALDAPPSACSSPTGGRAGSRSSRPGRRSAHRQSPPRS